ncbi:hypothetical protein RQP46_002021 [Phenoliferia psychrophenolica]
MLYKSTSTIDLVRCPGTSPQCPRTPHRTDRLGQAFLFQTALAGDSAQSARIISMALSILITILTLQLFTRQLQAEAADHAWLEDWEKRHHVHPTDCAHGETWQKYRSVPPKRARCFKFLASIRGFTLWSNVSLIQSLAFYVAPPKLSYLFTAYLYVTPNIAPAVAGPEGTRELIPIVGGNITGQFKGHVLNSGADWVIVDPQTGLSRADAR